MTVRQYLLENVYILPAELGMSVLRQLRKTSGEKNQTLMKVNLLLKNYVQVTFEFKICCLYCCQSITEREFTKAFQAMSKNREFDKKVLEVSRKRNDALVVSVKGRIRFTTDLHAAGPVYHMPAIHLLEQVKI